MSANQITPQEQKQNLADLILEQRDKNASLKRHIEDLEGCVDRRERIILGLENDLDLKDRALAAASNEAERLRARVSELESSLAEVLGNYEDSMDFPLVKRAHKALSGSAGEPEEPMDKPPVTIYLIPGEDLDGQIGYLWCDDPAPTDDHDPAEAVEYVRVDSIAREEGS